MKPTARLLAVTAAALTVWGTTGCGPKKPAEPRRAEIGRGMEKSGVMTETNYVRLRAQIDSIRSTGKISDTDLDWSLALLKQSQDPLAHSCILTGLSVLRYASASQKARINAALKPYLSSSSLLDQKSAARLQRTMAKL